MKREQLETIAWYALYAAIGAGITAGLQLAAAVSAPGDIDWRAILGVLLTAFFGSVATAWGSSRQTRPGSEPIRDQVDGLRDMRVSRQDMTVMSDSDAAALVAGDIMSMSTEGRRKVLERLEAQGMARAS